MDRPFNIHTHIFNVKCAPANFHGKGLGYFINWLLNRPWYGKAILTLLDGINPYTKKPFGARLANFFRIGLQKNQEEIWWDLLKSNDASLQMSYVVLTMDMDYMGAGAAPLNYLAQIDEVASLKRKYPNHIFPFLGIDPRRSDTDGLLSICEEYIEKKGFSGVKIYPPLGFYPFHPNLLGVFEYCVANDLPVMTHCDSGGIYFQGELNESHANPESFAAEKPKGIPFPLEVQKNGKIEKISNGDFKHHFTDPKNYEIILNHPGLKELKLCLAHYGGIEEISRDTGGWYHQIREMLIKYPNVYTDISFTLWDTGNDLVMTKIIADIDDGQIGSKILFGTDYFMTIRKKSENVLISDFKKKIGETRFHKIAVENTANYISSKVTTSV